MKTWLPIALGIVAILVGIVWTLQGLAILPGSVMSGVTMWAIIGPIVALAGVVLLLFGLYQRRRAR